MQEKRELPEGIGFDWVPEFPDSIECKSERFPGTHYATRREGILVVGKAKTKMGPTGRPKISFTSVDISEKEFFHNFTKVEK